MILFMLDNLDFPLTNSQLSEFFVNHGYTSYFHLQQAINELVESEFVRAETIRNTTNYHLISSGKEALSMFHTQISEPIKNDILDYFAEKKYQLRKEVDITADYYPLKKKRGEYMVSPLLIRMPVSNVDAVQQYVPIMRLLFRNVLVQKPVV